MPSPPPTDVKCAHVPEPGVKAQRRPQGPRLRTARPRCRRLRVRQGRASALGRWLAPRRPLPGSFSFTLPSSLHWFVTATLFQRNCQERMTKIHSMSDELTTTLRHKPREKGPPPGGGGQVCTREMMRTGGLAEWPRAPEGGGDALSGLRTGVRSRRTVGRRGRGAAGDRAWRPPVDMNARTGPVSLQRPRGRPVGAQTHGSWPRTHPHTCDPVSRVSEPPSAPRGLWHVRHWTPLALPMAGALWHRLKAAGDKDAPGWAPAF